MLTYNDHGVILTVDIVSEGSFGQIVIPIATAQDSEPAHKERMCFNAVKAFQASAQTALAACLSERCAIIGIQAEGMVNGNIPYRENYAAADYVLGIRGVGEDVEPSSVGVVIDWYFDPADFDPPTDVPYSGKTHVAHNTIFGITEIDTGGNVITDTLKDLVETFADELLNGNVTYNDTSGGGDNLVWYRVNRAVRGAAHKTLYRAFQRVVKSIVGTVKNRLAPPRR